MLRADIAAQQGVGMFSEALNICMYAALHCVERTVPAESQCRKQQVYMHDRMWTANSPPLLIRFLQAWYEFGELAVLCEALTKHSSPMRRNTKEGSAVPPRLFT